MPFHRLTMGDEGERPELLAGEEILFEQPLVYLWSGDDIRRDAEGRGTLLLTSRRVLFLSDESIAKSGDGLSKSVGWTYSDFSLHATSLSRTNWPHQFLLAKLNGPEDDDDEDGGDEQKGDAKAAKVWTRRCARGDGDDSDGGQYSDEEDASTTAAPASSAAEPVMYDRVVEELRFVPPKPAEQLPLIYAAWNRGDDLNTSDAEDEDDEEDDAASSSSSAAAASSSSSSSSFSMIPPGRSAAPSSAHAAMLRRLDRMLVVAPPVVRPTHQAPLPPSPPSETEPESEDPYAVLSSSFAASSIAASEPAPFGPLRSCAECMVDRHESEYSGAQLKKKSKRVCKRCIARKNGELITIPQAVSQAVMQQATAAAAAQRQHQQQQQKEQQEHIQAAAAAVAAANRSAAASSSGAQQHPQQQQQQQPAPRQKQQMVVTPAQPAGSLPAEAARPSSSSAMFASIMATAQREIDQLQQQP